MLKHTWAPNLPYRRSESAKILGVELSDNLIGNLGSKLDIVFGDKSQAVPGATTNTDQQTMSSRHARRRRKKATIRRKMMEELQKEQSVSQHTGHDSRGDDVDAVIDATDAADIVANCVDAALTDSDDEYLSAEDGELLNNNISSALPLTQQVCSQVRQTKLQITAAEFVPQEQWTKESSQELGLNMSQELGLGSAQKSLPEEAQYTCVPTAIEFANPLFDGLWAPELSLVALYELLLKNGVIARPNDGRIFSHAHFAWWRIPIYHRESSTDEYRLLLLDMSLWEFNSCSLQLLRSLPNIYEPNSIWLLSDAALMQCSGCIGCCGY